MSKWKEPRITADTVEVLVNNLAIERRISRAQAIVVLERILQELKRGPARQGTRKQA